MPKIFHDGGESLNLQISRGKTRGARHIHKFGKNDGINSSIETVWAAGGLHYNPTTAGTVEIVSTSIEDVSTGDGLATMVIEGLDSNYDEISETIALDGTTPVTTVNSYLRVHRAYGTDLGSGATIATNPQFTNLGTISGTHANLINPNDTVIYIPPNVGQTQLGLYTVPRNHTAYIYEFATSAGKETVGSGTNPVATVRLLQRPNQPGTNCAWRIVDELIVKDTAIEIIYPIPLRVEELTDLEVRAFTTSDTIPVSCEFDFVLIEND